MKIQQLLRDNAQRTKVSMAVVRNSADEATLYIYDIIDKWWGVSAQSVLDQLAEVADAGTVHVRINSPGGDVFEAKAIAEALRRVSGKTIAHIDSLAASAATSIAIACTEVEMAKGAFFMIHNATSGMWGDKADLRQMADLLEKVEGTIVDEYVGKTGKAVTDITAWMDAETWFTADEAIAAGFADRLAATADAAASNTWNLAAFSNAPKALQVSAPAPPAPVPHGTGQANTNKLRLAMA